MYLKIKWWKGRLGNNILQLIYALNYAKYYKINLSMEPHEYFKKTEIILYPEKTDKIYYYDNETDFTNKNKIKINYKETTLDINQIFSHKFTREHLLNIFNIDLNNINYFDKNTLIIYIRSGDLFPLDNTPVHGSYISAPYYYYDYILKKYKQHYNKYILVAEDTNNPIIKKLLHDYPNIIWKKNSLYEDLKIVLGSCHIVSCVGTFIKSLSWLNPNMKKVYLPSFVGKKDYYPRLEFEKIELKDFTNQIGKWKNTYIQKKLLINYNPYNLQTQIVKSIPKPQPKPIIKSIPKIIKLIPKPQPKPQHKPTAQPIVKPVAKPIVKPINKQEPKPTAQPIVKPVAKPIVKPINKQEPKPTAQPIVKPINKQEPKPTAQPIVKPVAKQEPNPPAQPIVKPVAKQEPKPTAQPIVKPVAKQEPNPPAQPIVKPVAKQEPKPPAQSIVKPVAKQEPKPPSQSIVKPVAKQEPKPPSQSIVKPVAKQEPKPPVQPIVKPIAKQEPKPPVQPIVKPIAKQVLNIKQTPILKINILEKIKNNPNQYKDFLIWRFKKNK